MMHADRNMIFDILLLINSENEKRKSSSFSIFDLSCQDNHHLKTATPLRNQGTHTWNITKKDFKPLIFCKYNFNCNVSFFS